VTMYEDKQSERVGRETILREIYFSSSSPSANDFLKIE
jgi:hypothetical protein